MIPLFFNRLPVSIAQKVELLFEKALKQYGSELYNVGKDKFIGDNLTVESLFPEWIIQEYQSNTSNVTIVPIVKQYLRWLYSMKYGYGAYIPWEVLRSPVFMPTELLQGLAELYFPGEDFSSDELSDILPNIPKFSIQVDYQYFGKKGTPDGIRYVLTTLMGYSYSTTKVISFSNTVIKIIANVSDNHKAFLERSVIPAGMVIIYEAP
jgi:hypothetical protein